MYTAKQLNDDKKRKATIDVLKKMADANHKQTVIDHLEAGGLDVRVALRVIAADVQPKRYLEIGVGMGWSLAQVMQECPHCECIAVDKWVRGYAGWELGYPSKDHELYQFGQPYFENGDSRNILPTLTEPFDLIFVDGGHSEQVARFDLYESAKLLNPGGVLVFDDYVDSNEGGIKSMIEVWAEFKAAHPDWAFAEITDALTPFTIGIKPAVQVKKADTLSEEKSKDISSTSTKKNTRTK